MKIGAGLSTDPQPERAAAEAAGVARSSLGGEDPSVAVLVVSRQHAPAADAILKVVLDEAPADRVIGCVAEAVVGGGREVEEGPAVSVWLAALPQPVETFHVEYVSTPSGGAFAGYLFDRGGPGPYVLIADPFTFPAELLLHHLNRNHPGTVVMGGMASGAVAPGQTRLFLDDRIVPEGAVGVRLAAVRIHPIVSQGCRPVGDVFTVTKSEGNVIHELGGEPPLVRLDQLMLHLSPEERALIGQGLHIGRVIDEYKTELGPGDFLVRGVVGADRQTGAIAVGDRIEVGEAVQFHIRDATTADRDLRSMLDRVAGERARGGLLFTCNGRGTRLFPVPDHDAALVQERLGELPLAGFNCAGEIGPVGGRNFLHGFTASVALFCEA